MSVDAERLKDFDGVVNDAYWLHETFHPPSTEAVFNKANTILDGIKSKLLETARANRDTETLIQMRVVAKRPGIYSPEVEIRDGLWARITDGPRIPCKNFPDGIPFALGGGAFAVQLNAQPFSTDESKQADLADFILLPRSAAFPNGAIIETSEEFDIRDPETITMSTSALGSTRLRQTVDSSVILGQRYTDEEEISSFVGFADEICWAIDFKHSQLSL